MVHIFGRYFFPNIIAGDYETPEVHLEILEFLATPGDGAGIIPRGFSKSTWTKIDSLHDIVYAYEPVILYIGDTLQNAGFHFESMKGELETNELLIYVYGDLVPNPANLGRKWTNMHFETTNGVNVVARGANKGRGVNIRNNRPTKIIIDDAETDEQVNSSYRRQKFARWLKETIMPSRDKTRGRIKMIGTAIHPEAEILKFYKGHGGIFRRASEDDLQTSIWPEYWPVEDLLRLRDGYTDEEGVYHEGIGTRAFNQEYQNNPVNDTDGIFKRAWLDSWTYERTPSAEELKEFFTIKMTVDPQAGEKEGADFLGVAVVGQDRRTGKRWNFYTAKFKGSITKQVEYIYSVYCQWNPVVLGVEKIMNQTALYQLLSAGYDLKDDEGKLNGRKFFFRLVPLSPKSKNKVERSKYIEPLVEQGRCLFSPSQVDLYNQLLEFPNGEHDDIADAWFYVQAMFDTNSVKLKAVKSSMITGGLRNRKF